MEESSIVKRTRLTYSMTYLFLSREIRHQVQAMSSKISLDMTGLHMETADQTHKI